MNAAGVHQSTSVANVAPLPRTCNDFAFPALASRGPLVVVSANRTRQVASSVRAFSRAFSMAASFPQYVQAFDRQADAEGPQ